MSKFEAQFSDQCAEVRVETANLIGSISFALASFLASPNKDAQNELNEAVKEYLEHCESWSDIGAIPSGVNVSITPKLTNRERGGNVTES